MDNQEELSQPIEITPRRRGRPPRIPQDTQSKIRCQCGSEEEGGEMIECEQCKDWQHIDCMGITNSGDTDNYRCEVCKALATDSDEVMSRQNGQTSDSTESNRRTRKVRSNTEGLLEYLAEKTSDISSPLKMIDFFEKYKQLSGHPNAAGTIQLSFRQKIASNIHRMPQFDDETKVKMLFGSSTPIDDGFLKKLKMTATVQVDKHQRIAKYVSKEGNLSLKGKHKGGAPRTKKPIGGSKPSQIARARPSLQQSAGSDSDDDIQIIPNPHRELCIPIKSEPNYPIYQTPTMYPQNSQQVAIPKSEFSASNYNNNFMGTPSGNQNMNVLDMSLMMMSRFMDMQTNFTNQMIMARNHFSTQQHGSSSASSSSTSSESSDETTSVKDFLKFIKMYILDVNNLLLSDLYHRIVIQLQNFGNGDQMIPKRTLRLALESAFALCATTDYSTRISASDTASAKDFFKFIQIYVASQNNQQFASLREQLNLKINAPGSDQEKLQISKINQAFEAALSIISED